MFQQSPQGQVDGTFAVPLVRGGTVKSTSPLVLQKQMLMPTQHVAICGIGKHASVATQRH